MESDSCKTLFIQDIPGCYTFLVFNGIPADFRTEATGRVVGAVVASPEVYRLLAEFQGNPQIRLLDFLSLQRRLRGRMLDLRDGPKNGTTDAKETPEMDTGKHSNPTNSGVKHG